ncbi:MAG TPA: hypothetical protein VH092_26175 [Urbifossiella sp.]|jgi:hypothetical protein|nr:hypothetical protein [Urbifossiella sp.]
MAWGGRVQSIAALTLTLALGWRGAAALAGPPGENLRNPAIRETAWLAVAAWALGWPRAWRGTGAGVWAWGAAAAAFHVAVALHAGHGWSHAAAVRHTEETSGVGAGVFVNYAFVLVWVADAAWLALRPQRYRRRPRWLTWAVHGFLAFVVVNAAVVFAADGRTGLLWAVLIPLIAVWTWGKGERPA